MRFVFPANALHRLRRDARAAALPATLTLAAGTAGGLACLALGVPAPWISGALIAVTVLALCGAPTRVPDPIRFCAFLVLGCSMGTAISPDMLARAATWPVSMAMLALSVVAVVGGVTAFLCWIARWPFETAFYASIPGALSAVMAMAATSGADMRKVALGQSLRLFVLVAALPHLIGASGAGHAAAVVPVHETAWGQVALMLAVSLVAGMAAARARVPGGLLVGALAGSAVLHGSGLVDAQLPSELLVPSFIILGAGVGMRFEGTRMADLKASAIAALGAVLVALTISAAFALLAAWLTGDEIGKLVVAFAPGALETMSVLGFALGFDPAFMSAHHIFRFASLSIAMPLAAHLLFSARGARKDDAS